MKKILLLVFSISGMLLAFGPLASLNAAPYQQYVDAGTANNPVTSDTWISEGQWDYLVFKGYTPTNVLTNSAGTPVGTYFVSSGVGAGTFKEDGTGYTVSFGQTSSVELWNGTAWVSFIGDSVTVRKVSGSFGYYKFGGATLIFNLASNGQIGIRRALVVDPLVHRNKADIVNGTNNLYGVSVNVHNEIITINGDVSPGTYNKNVLISNISNLAKNTTYTMTIYYISGTALGEDFPQIQLTSATSSPVVRHTLYVENSDGLISGEINRTGITSHTFTTGAYDVNAIRVRVDETTYFEDWKFRIQIELGNTHTQWDSAYSQINDFWFLQSTGRFHLDNLALGTVLNQENNIPVPTTAIFYNESGTPYAADKPMVTGGKIKVRYTSFESGFRYEFWSIASVWVPFTNLSYQFSDLEPVLDGQVAFVTNVDNPISEANIRGYITAWDDVDGNISHLIQIDEDDYTPNMNTLGEWDIVYVVSDSSGNTSYLTVTVLVRDIGSPNMALSSWSGTVSYTATLNIEALKNSMVLSDNYYPANEIAVTVISNSYTSNKTIPGTYTIEFQAKDPSNNTKNAVYTITVIDDVAPIATYSPVIVKPASSTLTLAQIRADITATDIISGNVTNTLEVVSDGYTGKGNKVGNHVIEFRVRDAALNYLYFTVTVQVKDDFPPVYMVVPGYFIRVEDIFTLTLEDFVNILQSTGQLNMSGTTSYTALLNEYSGNESTPGRYAVSMRFISTSGQEEIKSFAVEVIERESSDGVIDDPNGNFLEKYQTEIYYVGGALILIISFFGLIAFYKSQVKASKRNRRRYR